MEWGGRCRVKSCNSVNIWQVSENAFYLWHSAHDYSILFHFLDEKSVLCVPLLEEEEVANDVWMRIEYK